MSNSCCVSCMLYGLVGAVLVVGGGIVGNELADTKGMLIGGGIGLGALALLLCQRYLSQGCDGLCNHPVNQESIPLATRSSSSIVSYTY